MRYFITTKVSIGYRVTPLLVCCFFLITVSLAAQTIDNGWPRHTIDKTGRGADGVRLYDVDQDGREDIVTGWEQSGHVCIYFCPEPTKTKEPWPRVVVGQRTSVEDAVAIDTNEDGIAEIISCHEGGQQCVLVHRFQRTGNSPSREELLDSRNWETTEIASCHKQTRWMFAAPIFRANALQGILLGSKNTNGQVALLAPPADPLTEAVPIESWSLIPLQPAGWIMSIFPYDMDNDGDDDVVISDRKGSLRGVYWLEHPDESQLTTPGAWRRHEVVGNTYEVMFLDVGDNQITTATRDGVILKSTFEESREWTTIAIENPLQILNGKAVRRLGLQASETFVLTTNTGTNAADRKKPGVYLFDLSTPDRAINVSGPEGKKFDCIEVQDLDNDGDLDIITCEERDNLGVFWYENPGKKE
ncbi:FG-GAP repeat [Planctomycetales bacterium 10988]|nr:FG-GAP repeat [Planctomycetales bacterium 10988]